MNISYSYMTMFGKKDYDKGGIIIITGYDKI